jgi:hypothetical protein
VQSTVDVGTTISVYIPSLQKESSENNPNQKNEDAEA